MQHAKNWSQYSLDSVSKYGVVRLSIAIALVLVFLAALIEIAICWVFFGQVKPIYVVDSIVFGFIFVPCAVYLFAFAAKQLKKRERAEKALFDSMQALEDQSILLRSLIDGSPDLIYYRNKQGQFSGANKAIEQLTGKSKYELFGLTPKEVYPEHIANQIVKTDQEVLNQEKSVSYEQWFRFPDGREACFEMRKMPFYSAKNELLGLMGFGRDISAHKRYQEKLKQASRDKTTFISTISHELRTPLNAIVGFSHQLLENAENKTQRDKLRTIYVSAHALGQIFSSVIELDKAERQKLELFPEPIDLVDFVKEIKYTGKLMAEQAKLTFSFDVLTPLPKTLLLDATRLRQILWNLLSNAFKFTQHGSVCINVSCQIKNAIARLCFEVEDSGVGIESQELENIFKLYYQAKHNEHKLHAAGTGIGLAVSKQHAELMGGKLEVESELGFGSTFRLELSAPIYSLENQVSEKQASDKNKPRAQYHFLLVEDLELNIEVATAYLKKLGHHFVIARAGKEALEIYPQYQFDFVLLDINLPDMTGFEIAWQLKQQYPCVPPLIALTANVVNDRNQYFAKGMDEVLTKPFSIESLADIIVKFTANKTPPSYQKKPSEKKTKVTNCAQLDFDFIHAYVEQVGIKAIKNNISLLKGLMPEYLVELHMALTARNESNIIAVAHKIKGAVSAVGLQRIQSIAHKLQSSSQSLWWENIESWFLGIKQYYDQDLLLLENYLEQYASLPIR